MNKISRPLVMAAVGTLLMSLNAGAAVLPTGAILINAGAASTATTAVTLTLTATDTGGTGLLSMRFRNNTVDPYSTWEPFQTPRAWTLTSEPGTKKVYAQFMDGAGNISDANPTAAGAQAYMDSIEFIDKTPPAGSILINNGAASTSTKAVTLTLSATDTGGSGVASMRFRNSEGESYGLWEPYQITKAWNLTGGPGTRKAYVQFMDVAGNISDANPAAAGSQPYSDAIAFDDTVPPTGSIVINDGDVSTSSTAVTLTLTATDADGSGVASMRFRNRDADPYGAWEAYQTSREWTLPEEPGTRKVSVQFADVAGNISDANPSVAGAQGYSDSIVLSDLSAPTGSIVINNGDASTDSTAVTLTLSATDTGGSGIASMRLRNGAADPYGAWETYQETKAWTLTSDPGTKEVYVQFVDGAGNVSDADPAVADNQGYLDAIELSGDWTVPGDLSDCAACHGNPPHVGKDGIAGTDDDAPNVMTYWSGSVRREQDGGHGDPDGVAAALACTDCHDLSLPASPNSAKHGTGTYNSLWNNTTRSTNTSHLKAEFFTEFPANAAGDWSIQVGLDNYCTWKCHDTNKNGTWDGTEPAGPFRHSKDVAAGGDAEWSVQFPQHLSKSAAEADSTDGIPIDIDLSTDAGGYFAPCVSCHDPHGTGTQKQAARSSNLMLRFTMPTTTSNELCSKCHR